MRDREQWAEEHGYSSYTCPLHGRFYSDTGEPCPNCPEPAEKDDCDSEKQNFRGDTPSNSAPHSGFIDSPGKVRASDSRESVRKTDCFARETDNPRYQNLSICESLLTGVACIFVRIYALLARYVWQ